MDRDSAIAGIARHAEALKARGIAAAYLFGSTARDQRRPGSDIDIFIDIEPGHRFSLLDLIAAQHFLEDELGTPVDLVTRAGLHPMLRDGIEREAIQVL